MRKHIVVYFYPRRDVADPLYTDLDTDPGGSMTKSEFEKCGNKVLVTNGFVEGLLD